MADVRYNFPNETKAFEFYRSCCVEEILVGEPPELPPWIVRVRVAEGSETEETIDCTAFDLDGERL